jgi:hypothetical protein
MVHHGVVTSVTLNSRDVMVWLFLEILAALG